MLKGKKVTIGITGSIAAYKMANVASMLVKRGCDVHVVMTENAAQFITPITFETLTKNPCHIETFERKTPIEMHHLTLGQTADVFLIAPASADAIGKIAHGIADDLLTTAALSATCPICIAPAMNTHMYQNSIVQDNIKRLKALGYRVLEPEVGRLACEAVGVGKLPEEAAFIREIEAILNEKAQGKKDFLNLRVLVTAGPTRESIDPVRFLTNHSTGKMGYAVAKAAQKRGARVTLITGPVALAPLDGADMIPVTTAEEMYQAVMQREEQQDIIVKAAAVADYTPKRKSAQKTKKQDGEKTLELKPTKDILLELGKRKRKGQCICGFSMETERVLSNSKEKRKRKNADMIAANSLTQRDAGFGSDTNRLILITEEYEEDIGMHTKEECAEILLDRLYEIWKRKQQETKMERL